MFIALFLATSVVAATPNLTMCSSEPRINCVVDGDTLYLSGTKIRLEGYDTPEPVSNICGGAVERELAAKASARLLELLNGNEWTISFTGKKGNYGRLLATIHIDGRNVGDILIKERLARQWPHGDEFWCP
jgi:endonuclease YncB( thermonuclease family)